MKCDPSKGPGGVVQVNGCIATLSLCVGGRRGGQAWREDRLVDVEEGLEDKILASRASDGSYLWYVCVSGVCMCECV